MGGGRLKLGVFANKYDKNCVCLQIKMQLGTGQAVFCASNYGLI